MLGPKSQLHPLLAPSDHPSLSGPTCKVELTIAEAVERTESTHVKQSRCLAQSKCAINASRYHRFSLLNVLLWVNIPTESTQTLAESLWAPSSRTWQHVHTHAWGTRGGRSHCSPDATPDMAQSTRSGGRALFHSLTAFARCKSHFCLFIHAAPSRPRIGSGT